ncbi:hypothetical protein ABZ805_28280 [Saccharopolyspora sp. NPDC047091]|uniref:hypothetical protein n=1 Tax=Saccharopolyspora sp. NPDC047091 TaxID=3155924 RepID=UPI0033F674DA
MTDRIARRPEAVPPSGPPPRDVGGRNTVAGPVHRRDEPGGRCHEDRATAVLDGVEQADAHA